MGMGRCGGDVLDGVGACMILVSGPAVTVRGGERGESRRGRWELSIVHLTCEAAVKM